MIKLMPIVKKILNESRYSGTHEYTFEIDNQNIPVLCQKTDVVEIIVKINYEYSPGYRRSRSDPSENPEVDIDEWDIKSIVVISEDGKKHLIDLRFLHFIPKKILYTIIEKHLEKNKNDIENEIMNGVG